MGKEEPRTKHTHRYIKIGGKYASIWKCADPDCRHFVYSTQDYIVEGRSSFCWECGKKFILDRYAMDYAVRENEGMPKCHDCMFPDPLPEEDKPTSEE